MKKWIAMLLAVMMLVLPLAGLAEAPEELMDKALDDGLTLETTVSFSAGNLPFGDEINTPVADLLNALSFYHLENENDQSVFAVRLSGEDALRVELERSDTSYRFLDGCLMRSQIGVAFYKGGDGSLRDELDRALSQLKKSGSLSRILGKYDVRAEAEAEE